MSKIAPLYGLLKVSDNLKMASLVQAAQCSWRSFSLGQSETAVLKMNRWLILKGPPISDQWGWLSAMKNLFEIDLTL